MMIFASIEKVRYRRQVEDSRYRGAQEECIRLFLESLYPEEFECMVIIYCKYPVLALAMLDRKE